MATAIKKLNTCILTPMHKDQTQLQATVEIPVEIETSAHSKLLVFWGVEQDELKIERYARCPRSDWQPHKVCGRDALITDSKCEVLLYLPGSYRISMRDNSAIPDRIQFEEISVSAETVQLYFAEKRACCCE